MNWISVLVGAASAALAALLAMVFVGKDKPIVRGAVFVVLMLVLVGSSTLHITPRLKAWAGGASAMAQLERTPTFAAIKQHHPEVFARIKASVEEAARSGAKDEALGGAARQHVMKLVERQLPRASDESVATYLQVTMGIAATLQRKDPALCFAMFHPQGTEGVMDMLKLVSPEQKKADLDALADVIRSAATAPQPVPKEAEVAQDLQLAVNALVARHGQDVAMLQNPAAPGVSKAKVCAMTIDMGNSILAMPPQRSGKLWRHLASLT